MSNISILVMGENPNYSTNFIGVLWQEYEHEHQKPEQTSPAEPSPFPFCRMDIDENIISCYGISPDYDFDLIRDISGREETGVVVIVDSIDTASVLYGEKLADYCSQAGVAIVIGLLNTELQKPDEFKKIFSRFTQINPMILPINLNNVKEAEVSLLILYNMILYKYVGFARRVN